MIFSSTTLSFITHAISIFSAAFPHYGDRAEAQILSLKLCFYSLEVNNISLGVKYCCCLFYISLLNAMLSLISKGCYK